MRTDWAIAYYDKLSGGAYALLHSIPGFDFSTMRQKIRYTVPYGEVTGLDACMQSGAYCVYVRGGKRFVGTAKNIAALHRVLVGHGLCKDIFAGQVSLEEAERRYREYKKSLHLKKASARTKRAAC